MLYGLDKSFRPFTYFQLLLPIFAAAIVGGLGSPLGAIAGGFLIAFSEVTVTYAFKKIVNYLLPENLQIDALAQLLSTDYKFAVSFVDPDHRAPVPPDGPLQGEIGMSSSATRQPPRIGRLLGNERTRTILLFVLVFGLILSTGFTSSWNVALNIFNMGLISAIMALGVNMQWGYAGLFNIGIMGFVALGGLGAVIVSMPPVTEGWAAGGLRVVLGPDPRGDDDHRGDPRSGRRWHPARRGSSGSSAILVGGFFLFRYVFDGGVMAVEAINPASAGNLGGLGLPVLLSWPVGALLAAGAAWLIGKTALGLRSDYLAIATLGIAEIVIAVLKNEDWLARGVKNVIGIPRPVPVRGRPAGRPRLRGAGDLHGLRPGHGVVDRGEARLYRTVRDRAPRASLASARRRSSRHGAG